MVPFIKNPDIKNWNINTHTKKAQSGPIVNIGSPL